MFHPTEIDNNIFLYHGDCLDVLPSLAARGVKADLILADPPYGTTHCRWDSVIDFPLMWNAIRGVCRDRTRCFFSASNLSQVHWEIQTCGVCGIAGFGKRLRLPVF